MSEKPLLLSSAKTGVLVEKKTNGWQYFFAGLGIFVVLVGAADLTSRLAHALAGSNAMRLAFAPAAILDAPGIFGGPSAPHATSSSFVQLATTTPITPARLRIPSIGVDATIEQVGAKDDGSMGTPQKFGDAAWYALGPKPGEEGTAAIDGHVNNALTTPGVFEHLDQLQPGDKILVSNTSSTLTFVVTRTESIPADTPSDSIFTRSGASEIVLITCIGDWIPSQKSFDKRLVVFASLARQ